MKILVAIDGSEQALAAARHALHLNKAGLQASYVLATVQEPAYDIETMLTPNAGSFEKKNGVVGARVLKRAEAMFDAANVPFVRDIAFGEAVPQLLELVQRHGCDSIIMGARGMGFLRSALMGSVSDGVLHSSSHAVVTIVRQPASH